MDIIKSYNIHKTKISARLADFKKVKEEDYMYELLFCLLTPQSNARKCWSAVEEIKKLSSINSSKVNKILQTRTRFHNNKTRYVLEAVKDWKNISSVLKQEDKWALRNHLAESINGLGYKEAGHFLRNIGKSDNKVAILDRHILRNLKNLGIINDEKINNKKHYLHLEQAFLEYADKVNIPIDHLDLLFWSNETGEVFK